MWICPYDGFENEDEDSTCPVCGGSRPDDRPDLSDTSQLCVMRVPHANKSAGPALVLTEIKSGARVVISDEGGIVGRTGDYEPGLFAPTVSRKHLIVQRHGDGWAIRHVGTNDTVVFSQGEAVTLQKAATFPLYGGETLKIATMFFDVSLEQIEPEPNPEPNPEPEPEPNPKPDLVEGWFVDCPVCGAAIRVSGPDQRVRQCPRCIDAMDRRRVAKFRPSQGSRPKDVVVDAG